MLRGKESLTLNPDQRKLQFVHGRSKGLRRIYFQGIVQDRDPVYCQPRCRLAMETFNVARHHGLQRVSESGWSDVEKVERESDWLYVFQRFDRSAGFKA